MRGIIMAERRRRAWTAACATTLGLWTVPSRVVAQTAAAVDTSRDAATPATSNVRGAQYPRIHLDGRVTFRLTARGARTVQLVPGGPGLGSAPYAMRREGDGV